MVPWMSRQGDRLETRGAGPPGRVDAFRVRARGIWLVAASLVGLGLFAIAAAIFDLGQARQTGDAYWLAPSGVFLLAVAAGLGWFRYKRPVVMTVGPDGLFMPLTWAGPLAWRDVWRMRCVRQRSLLRQPSATLEVDLSPGAEVPYKRWAQTIPGIERWFIRKFGLRVPLQSLDAEVDTVLASIKRFKPVSAVAK
jgi:hypothetical protein